MVRAPSTKLLEDHVPTPTPAIAVLVRHVTPSNQGAASSYLYKLSIHVVHFYTLTRLLLLTTVTDDEQ